MSGTGLRFRTQNSSRWKHLYPKTRSQTKTNLCACVSSLHPSRDAGICGTRYLARGMVALSPHESWEYRGDFQTSIAIIRLWTDLSASFFSPLPPLRAPLSFISTSSLYLPFPGLCSQAGEREAKLLIPLQDIKKISRTGNEAANCRQRLWRSRARKARELKGNNRKRQSHSTWKGIK